MKAWKVALERVWRGAVAQVAHQLEVHTDPEVLAESDEKQVRHIASTLDIAVDELGGASRFTAEIRVKGNGKRVGTVPTRFLRCVKVADQLARHRKKLYEAGLLKSRLVDDVCEEARVAVEGAVHTCIWQLASGHPKECVCTTCLTAKVDDETPQKRADQWFFEYTGGFRRECGG